MCNRMVDGKAVSFGEWCGTLDAIARDEEIGQSVYPPLNPVPKFVSRDFASGAAEMSGDTGVHNE